MSPRTAPVRRNVAPDGLAPRRQPRQERARRSVDTMLDTAATLLDEVGVTAFNTNLLADRAGLRVRTVYRYFPNKEAVIAELAERMTREWDRWFDGFAALADPAADWERIWEAAIERFYTGVRGLPGGTAVRRAMQAVPALRAIDQRDNARLARTLAGVLRRRGVSLPPARLRAVARVVVETASTTIDLALHGDVPAPRVLLDELKQMQIRYMRPYLEPSKSG